MSSLIPRGNIRAMFAIQVTFDPAAVATVTTAEQSLTVQGLAPGDLVFWQKPSNTAGVGVVNMRVSAANTLQVIFVNPTAGSVNAASETWTLLVFRPEVATLPAIVPPM
jgi:uncharacterized protein YijF (DUF1287 family)